MPRDGRPAMLIEPPGPLTPLTVSCGSVVSVDQSTSGPASKARASPIRRREGDARDHRGRSRKARRAAAEGTLQTSGTLPSWRQTSLPVATSIATTPGRPPRTGASFMPAMISLPSVDWPQWKPPLAPPEPSFCVSQMVCRSPGHRVHDIGLVAGDTASLPLGIFTSAERDAEVIVRPALAQRRVGARAPPDTNCRPFITWFVHFPCRWRGPWRRASAPDDRLV